MPLSIISNEAKDRQYKILLPLATLIECIYQLYFDVDIILTEKCEINASNYLHLCELKSTFLQCDMMSKRINLARRYRRYWRWQNLPNQLHANKEITSIAQPHIRPNNYFSIFIYSKYFEFNPYPTFILSLSVCVWIVPILHEVTQSPIGADSCAENQQVTFPH